MFCSKCGTQNVNGEKFCKTCGSLLENNQPQQPMNNNVGGQSINNGMVGQPIYNQSQSQQYTDNSGGLNSNYVNQAVNPNMKKWAILSIIIPIVAMIWYWFIGLSFYLAIFIAATGFGFADKGKMSNQKLATIGKVLNGILFGMSVIMLILSIIGIFAK